MSIWTEKENYSLSAADIEKLVGGHIPIVKYPDLQNYDVNSFLKLFNNDKRGFIIFFETESQTVGHWEACMMLDGNTIAFFDSYGLRPDEAEDFLSKETDIKLKENKPWLTDLLNQCETDKGYATTYSQFKFQKMVGDVSTCGRWSATRLFNHAKTDGQFMNYMTGLKQRWGLPTYDQTVVELTFKYLGK